MLYTKIWLFTQLEPTKNVPFSYYGFWLIHFIYHNCSCNLEVATAIVVNKVTTQKMENSTLYAWLTKNGVIYFNKKFVWYIMLDVTLALVYSIFQIKANYFLLKKNTC